MPPGMKTYYYTHFEYVTKNMSFKGNSIEQAHSQNIYQLLIDIGWYLAFLW